MPLLRSARAGQPLNCGFEFFCQVLVTTVLSERMPSLKRRTQTSRRSWAASRAFQPWATAPIARADISENFRRARSRL
jgi:hypothetical protein